MSFPTIQPWGSGKSMYLKNSINISIPLPTQNTIPGCKSRYGVKRELNKKTHSFPPFPSGLRHDNYIRGNPRTNLRDFAGVYVYLRSVGFKLPKLRQHQTVFFANILEAKAALYCFGLTLRRTCSSRSLGINFIQTEGAWEKCTVQNFIQEIYLGVLLAISWWVFPSFWIMIKFQSIFQECLKFPLLATANVSSR